MKKIFGILSIVGVFACFCEFFYVFYKQKMYTTVYFIVGMIALAIAVILAGIAGNIKDDDKENLKQILMMIVLASIGISGVLFLALFAKAATLFEPLVFTIIGTILAIGIIISLCIK